MTDSLGANSQRYMLIIDDHPLYCRGVCTVLSNHFLDYRIMSTSTAEQAITDFITAPEIIVMDVNLPGLSGIDALQSVQAHFQQSKIVLISGQEENCDVKKFFAAGAKAFISKAVSTERILSCLDDVIENRLREPTHVSSSTLAPLLEKTFPGLTSRQLEILNCLQMGYPNKDIAKRLDLAEVTIKKHISVIFKILEVNNRTQAVRIAKHLGLTSHLHEKATPSS